MARRAPRTGALPWLVLALALAGCGDDDPPPRTTVPAGAAATPAAAAGASSKIKLAVKPHIEDRVACMPPDQPSDPKGGKCDPKAPSCGEHLYCLQLAQGFFCEACPERDGIRHAFRDRDFDAELNRDPFQPPTGPSGPPPPDGLTKKCPREDQLVASSYSYSDLKLVGIVAQGTQRKVLMTMGKDGFIIKRGDCVGKEKAVVKDIGLGYVTFQGETDEYSVQLNPKQLLVNDPGLSPPARRTTITPVIPVPSVPAAPPSAPGFGRSAPPAAPGTAPPGAAAPGANPPPAAGAAAGAPPPPLPAPNKP
jgi:hypothetical protein